MCFLSSKQAWGRCGGRLLDYAVLPLAYPSLAAIIAKSVKAAKSAWLVGVSQTIALAAAKGDYSPLGQLVRRLSGKFSLPAQFLLRDADGSLPSSLAQRNALIRDRYLQEFDNQRQIMPTVQLSQYVARVKLERSVVVPQPASALHITVSMWADIMFRAFRHFRTGRSFPDGVPHELLRAGGFHAAVLYGMLAHAATRRCHCDT